MLWLTDHTLEFDVEGKGGVFVPASVTVHLATSCCSGGT